MVVAMVLRPINMVPFTSSLITRSIAYSKAISIKVKTWASTTISLIQILGQVARLGTAKATTLA